MEHPPQYSSWGGGGGTVSAGVEGANSPPIVPGAGRRTPLGAVGLGGFYLQSSPNMQPASQPPPHDENRPEAGPSHHSHRVPQSQRGMAANPGMGGGKQKARQGKSVRLNINARERRRMHDLNDALDELRSVIPYAHSPSVRKLSKIATLLLAKNYILMQANALEELRRLIAYLQGTASAAGIVAPAGFELGGFPAAAKLLQQQQMLMPPSDQPPPNSNDSADS